MMQSSAYHPDRAVFIVDGLRTPFLRAAGRPNEFSASDLAVAASRPLLARQPIEPMDLDEVVLGCAMPSPDEANIGRILALRAGCGHKVPGWTVMRNCASAMQALDSAAKDINSGRADLVLAGGTEAMSRAPLLYNDTAVNWFADSARARSAGAKVKTLAKMPMRAFLNPVIGLIRGLNDSTINVNMGQTCEIISHRFAVSREDMDAYSVQSHLRLADAFDEGRMTEVTDLYSPKGTVYTEDTGLRRDSSVEKLARLKPAFDRRVGIVTPGNSSQITDGAAMLLLASEDAVHKYDLKPLGRLVDVAWAALDPAQMGLGPVHASTPLLQRHSLSFDDIDIWEINEAFAGQVLACRNAWKDETYCRQELGLPGALGELDMAKLNVDGGAISIGHPVGASGSRITLHALQVLQQRQAKRAVATLCIGGGQGGAMLVERV
ncbi:MAG: acetyl-CoA C-acetyltransferase [Gammaproteobacteria bacterium]|nr:acetyl-CoA C-acetyltransferase [Gammaproteobacteria bacterium]